LSDKETHSPFALFFFASIAALLSPPMMTFSFKKILLLALAGVVVAQNKVLRPTMTGGNSPEDHLELVHADGWTFGGLRGISKTQDSNSNMRFKDDNDDK
jgi:hypothetical protein